MMATARKLHHLNAWDRATAKPLSRVVTSGIPALDELLPDGGWPKHDVVEIIVPEHETAAVELVLPALRRLVCQGRPVAMVTPPFSARVSLFADPDINANRVLQVNPHPGRSALWTVESMLETGDFAAVLAWPECDTELMDKRLRLAAAGGKSLCVLFRNEGRARACSGIEVRVRLDEGDTDRAIYRLNSLGEVLAGTTIPLSSEG